MKKCRFCAEVIQDEAKKCRFCGEWLVESRPQLADIRSGALKTVRPEISVKNEIDPTEIDDKKYRALKAKYESMGIDELLQIRESYTPHDYQPEARKALKEVFAKKKKELDVENRILSEEEEVTEEIPNFKLGMLYINLSLIGSGIAGSLIIVLIILGLFRILGSIWSAETVLMLILLVPISLTFFTAIGLQKRKKYAITLIYVSLALNSLLGLFLLFVGTGGGSHKSPSPSRPVEGILGAIISACWAVYFYRRRQYFR